VGRGAKQRMRVLSPRLPRGPANDLLSLVFYFHAPPRRRTRPFRQDGYFLPVFWYKEGRPVARAII